MDKNFFTLDEDFEKIIKNTFPDKTINSIKSVTTGWTNIVFEVNTSDGNYFFRFPRDDFWIRTIVKDYEFAKFINGKTDFNTVELNLFYDNGRPFSVHKKIEGTVLASKMDTLTPDEVKAVSNDIAKFMFQLHNIDYSQNEIFNIDNIGLNLTDFLNELLNVHVSSKDKCFWHYDEFSKKKHNCLVHGDLNSSNILLDENNRVCAIIDFGFGGFGNPYFDISRIIGRCPNNFKKEIIQSYENISNESLNYPVLDNEINIWTNIDNAYINYMRGIGIYN
jgi:aminoglycoside phosphotransferase (APT) family kinase protein